MCTAVHFKNNYFGRNLDLEKSYGESITILPRNYPIKLRMMPTMKNHLAMIGVSFNTPDADGVTYPLYYDAINEKGLGMAGLNFVGNAVFHEAVTGEANIMQFELVPWVLGQCMTVAEARELLMKTNFANEPFSEQLPVSELHWMLADQNEAIVVESVASGLKIYDNPLGVLTNNPPFDEQLFHLNNYMSLSPKAPVNTFAPEVKLWQYSRGLGAVGLPGDLSSQSRFVKAAFTRAHSVCDDNEMNNVSQFFHILHAVDQQRGVCDLGDNQYEMTIYSSGYNLAQGICYYTCYDNHQITQVDLHKVDLDGMELTAYPMITTEQIKAQN